MAAIMSADNVALIRRALDVQKTTDLTGITIEAWAQGFMVGALIVMAAVAFANMRHGVLLHKLILLELICGTFHGTFIFTSSPVYNWYLSATAIFLNFSWSLHNVIAWMKNKPFLSRWGSRFYIGTVILVQPYWILEIVANFLYFSNTSALFVSTRPYEALFRDPWWIYTCSSLLWNIKTRYEFGYIELMRASPRFAVLIGAMLLSIGFIIVDILAVTHVIDPAGLADGLNPFWKLAFVFKCLTDTIVLDDFKTALDRLKNRKLRRMGNLVTSTSGSDGGRGDFSNLSDFELAQSRRHQRRARRRSLPELTPDSQKSEAKSSADDEVLDLEAALHMERAEHRGFSVSTGG